MNFLLKMINFVSKMMNLAPSKFTHPWIRCDFPPHFVPPTSFFDQDSQQISKAHFESKSAHFESNLLINFNRNLAHRFAHAIPTDHEVEFVLKFMNFVLKHS